MLNSNASDGLVRVRRDDDSARRADWQVQKQDPVLAPKAPFADQLLDETRQVGRGDRDDLGQFMIAERDLARPQRGREFLGELVEERFETFEGRETVQGRDPIERLQVLVGLKL